jgi:hypothetical protein
MQSTMRIHADESGSARPFPNPLVQLVTDIVLFYKVSVLEDSLCRTVGVWIVCPNRKVTNAAAFDSYYLDIRQDLERANEDMLSSKPSSGGSAHDEDCSDDDAFSTKGFEAESATVVPFDEEL